MRVTWVLASRLELVAVAGRLIYASGTIQANACDVGPRIPSRVGRGRRAAVNFVVCFAWGEFLYRAFHELAFSNSFVDPV